MPWEDDSLVDVGAWGTVSYAVRRYWSMPAKEFYEARSKGDQAKLNNLFQRIAEKGFIANRTKFKQVEGMLHEFKSFRIRISCYRAERQWFLLHGF